MRKIADESPEEEKLCWKIFCKESDNKNDNSKSLSDKRQDDQKFSAIGVAPGTCTNAEKEFLT